MLRLLLMAAAAIGGGIAFGRKAIDRTVEKRVSEAVEIAQANAIAELDRAIRDIVAERLTNLGLNLVFKATLIAAAYALFATGELTATGFRIVTSAFIAAFVLRDIVRTAPYAAPALRLARQSGWSPRRALKAFVVGVVFERAYAEALAATTRGPHRFWIALSNYREQSISHEVAKTVSEVAYDTSFARARTLFVISALTAAAMLAAYAGFAALAFFLVQNGA
ncbi:MAG: hypothetical protein PVI23_09060 [Maricaulaceae bacterium]|jgi:hypothetical protein